MIDPSNTGGANIHAWETIERSLDHIEEHLGRKSRLRRWPVWPLSRHFTFIGYGVGAFKHVITIRVISPNFIFKTKVVLTSD
jgi:hypothetical protein